MNTGKKEEFYYVCATLPSNKFVPKLSLHLPPASLSFIAPPRINITKIPQQQKQLFGSSNGPTLTRHYFQLRVNGNLSITQERQLQLVNGVKNSPQKFTIGLRTLLRSSHDRQNFFQRRKMAGSDKNGFLQILVIPSCNQLNSEVIDNILEQSEPQKLGNAKVETIPTEDSITCNLDGNAQKNDCLSKSFQSRVCSTITNITAQREKQISQHMRERSMLKCRSLLRPYLFIKDTQTIDEPQTLLKIEKIASNMSYILILIVEIMLLTSLMSPTLRT